MGRRVPEIERGVAARAAESAEAELGPAAQQERLRLEADRLRALLSAFATHELRTPLSFLRATIGLLAEGRVDPASEVGQDLLARAAATTERLTRIANSLLELERLELGAGIEMEVPVEPGPYVVEAARSVALDRGVTIAASDETGGAALYIDPVLLTHAVTNLVANAVRFTSDGSIVDVTARVEDGALRVEVGDSGPGVAPDQRTAIFDAFHQTSPEHRSSGSGLGLAIVQRVAELHHGHVTVRDAPGGGSVFELVLRQVAHVVDESRPQADLRPRSTPAGVSSRRRRPN